MVEEEEEEMSEEEDEIEAGMDDLEEEKKAKIKPKKKAGKKAEEEAPQEIWEPIHQEALLGLRNTVTGTVIPGFQDMGIVQAMAVVLNMQERMSVALS